MNQKIKVKRNIEQCPLCHNDAESGALIGCSTCFAKNHADCVSELSKNDSCGACSKGFSADSVDDIGAAPSVKESTPGRIVFEPSTPVLLGNYSQVNAKINQEANPAKYRNRKRFAFWSLFSAAALYTLYSLTSVSPQHNPPREMIERVYEFSREERFQFDDGDFHTLEFKFKSGNLVTSLEVHSMADNVLDIELRKYDLKKRELLVSYSFTDKGADGLGLDEGFTGEYHYGDIAQLEEKFRTGTFDDLSFEEQATAQVVYAGMIKDAVTILDKLDKSKLVEVKSQLPDDILCLRFGGKTWGLVGNE